MKNSPAKNATFFLRAPLYEPVWTVYPLETLTKYIIQIQLQ